LVRQWGRIGGAGRTRIDLHASPPLAQIALNTWLERKRRRGYRLRA
jgi:predicted DNA-binding WGR domain protein